MKSAYTHPARTAENHRASNFPNGKAYDSDTVPDWGCPADEYFERIAFADQPDGMAGQIAGNVSDENPVGAEKLHGVAIVDVGCFVLAAELVAGLE